MSKAGRTSLTKSMLSAIPIHVSIVMAESLSYPVFMSKPSTHRIYDPGSIVPYIRLKVLSDNQMSRIKYNYYISNVSKDYDDS
jgi:hypothetical protein